MNMRAPNLIHGLTFDISFAGAASDSLELTDWIKTALLPVMDEVFAQHDREGELRRIEQLEIDLGTVSQDESRVELARRLFARLSEALGWSLENATASSLVEEREQQLGRQLLDFLRTGRLAWSVAGDTRAAHQQLLQRVLESAQAREVLRAAVGDPRMLARLLRQFDAASLHSVALLLSSSWPEQERAAAQRAARAVSEAQMDGIQAEPYWRRLLLSSTQPPAMRHEEEFQQLRRMLAGFRPAQRDALRAVWQRLAEDVRQRLGGRALAGLSAEAKSDLALILRSRALDLFAVSEGGLESTQLDTVLRLLLAGDDTIAAVDSMLLKTIDVPEVDAASVTESQSAATSQPIVLPHAAAQQKRMPANDTSRLLDHAVVQARQTSVALFTRVLRTFDTAQRAAFGTIWQLLSDEVAARTPGLSVTVLNITQKAELAMLLLPEAEALLKEFGQQWPELIAPQDGVALVPAAVQLLLAGGDASASVRSMLAGIGAAQADAVAQQYQVGAIPAALGEAVMRESMQLGRDSTVDGVASQDQAVSQDKQLSLLLFSRLWRTFGAAQRSAFRDIWHRLSGEIARRAGDSAVSTLNATQKSDLALILLPQAEAMLKEFIGQWPEFVSPQDKTGLARSSLRLLLEGDGAIANVEAILGAAGGQHNHEAEADIAGDVPPDHVGRQDTQASLGLLKRKSQTFQPAVRAAFLDIWRGLSGEVAGRTGGRVAAGLGEDQKAKFALTLRPAIDDRLKELRRQWPDLISLQDESEIAGSVVQLLLAADDVTADVAAMFIDDDDPRPVFKTTMPRDDVAIPQQYGITVRQTMPRRHETAAAGMAPESRLASEDLQFNLTLFRGVWQNFGPVQRETFRTILGRLAHEMTSGAGGRKEAVLNTTQKSALALTLRAVADDMLRELRRQQPAFISLQDEDEIAQSVVQMSLAGDDVAGEVAAILNDRHPAAPATVPRDDVAAPRRSGATMQETTPHSREATGTSLKNHVAPKASEWNLAFFNRVLSVFSPAQHEAFRNLWELLLREVDNRADGRKAAALSVAQKADLALTLLPAASTLLNEFRLQWPESVSAHEEDVFARTLVQLLLADDDIGIAVGSVLLTPQPDIPASAKMARSHEAEVEDAIQGSQPEQMAATGWHTSLAQLTRVWQAFDFAQREVFRDIWRRLVSQAVGGTDRRAVDALSPAQKADLTLALRPVAEALLNQLRLQWPESVSLEGRAVLAQSVVQLLLAGDDAVVMVESMFAGTDDQHMRTSLATQPQTAQPVRPANDTAPAMVTPSRASEAESDAAGGSPPDQTAPADHQKNLTLLTRLWTGFDPAQRLAFQVIWQRLSGEVASRTRGRPMAMLSAVQKTDLSLTLRPVAGVMLKKLRIEWPDMVSAQDEKAIVQSAVQLLLAGDDAVAAVVAMLADISEPRVEAPAQIAAPRQTFVDRLPTHTEVELTEATQHAADPAPARVSQETRTTIDPSLAAFRDWQQGKLDIMQQPLAISELRQWLNWWLLHDPQRVNQDCSLMLAAIDAQAEQVADPIQFLKLVLAGLQSDEALDLEALSLRCGQQEADDDMTIPLAGHTEPPASALSVALQSRAGLQQFIAQQDVLLSGLNSAQLHQIVRGWLQLQQGDAASLFMAAIEEHALQSASVHAFLRQVLLDLIFDQPVDLERLLAYTNSQVPSSAVEKEEDDDEHLHQQVPAPQTTSALPVQLKQALPQRLASAMLQADLGSLEIIWPEIVRSHSAELAEAAQRYLGRSELRTRLIAHADSGMLKDLLGALSRSALQLAEPILRHSAQFNAVLASPLTVAEFEQRVLRYAFEQAFKPDLGAIEWLHALMSGIQQMNDEQRRQLQHAWYQVLSATKQSTALLQALKRELFAQPVHSRGAPEAAASLLLMREADPDDAERAVLASLLQRVCAETTGVQQGALESALSGPRSIERLADILPSPMLARLFALLHSGLAARLPALLRQLQQVVPVTLAAAPATLDRRIWRAIYLAAFADGVTAASADFMRTLVIRLASQYRQADPAAWLEKIAGTTSDVAADTATGFVVTPDQAMAQLLQPWAEPKAEPPARKPQPSSHGDDEPQPFTGESNLHNAGLVIVAPYVQRLFGLLELTADGKFVSDEAAQRGVHLLQYVVTGEEATPEYQLVLNKLLCGIHGGVPIVAGISVTEKEKTIIEQMLNGVITHWSALGKTSIDGLRETFLHRQGHLYHQDDAWQLKIPQKTFDMLLDRLPWSFALIKMPWMTEPLHVTWR